MYSIGELWDIEMQQITLEYGKEPDPELWRWSPLDITEFDVMLRAACAVAPVNGGPLRFAEAGCGIGTKLYLARNHFDLEETGYEIDVGYLGVCRRLGVRAVQWDFREHAPPWADYDIIYVCRPFKDDAEEVAWEKSVMEAMRPGAVLVMSFAAVKPYSWPCHYRRPFRGVWSKPEASNGGHSG